MSDRKFRLPRLWSNQVLKRISHLFDGEIINVSGWKDDDKEGNKYSDYFTNAESYLISNYSGERGLSGSNSEIFIDLESDLDKEFINKFQVAFNHTTLEHVYDFKKAFKNICDLSYDIVIIIVPFIQEQHELESFKDFWRFTPSALTEMFNRNNLSVLYNDANSDRNAGNYLFFVGSKNPMKWNGKFETKFIEKDLGSWIGESLIQKIKKTLK